MYLKMCNGLCGNHTWMLLWIASFIVLVDASNESNARDESDEDQVTVVMQVKSLQGSKRSRSTMKVLSVLPPILLDW
jgi:hypothetical protein